MSPYGTLVLLREDGCWTLSVASYSVSNARTIPTIKMIREMLKMPELGGDQLPNDVGRTIAFVQYDDFAHNDIKSVAFGTKKGHSHLVSLIPDTYFYESKGYEATRNLVSAKKLPAWRDREARVFWRGSPTTNWKRDDGSEITEVHQILRVQLCDLLRFDGRTDVGVTGAWGGRDLNMLEYFREHDILRQRVSMEFHAQHRYLVDIDGVANAWGFFDKLLMGSCVLKVESSYRQWFYEDIRPWEHYVPVKSDLSDLAEKIDWCFNEETKAMEIARAGQEYALGLTFEAAVNRALQALCNSMISL